jgi:O-antigen ligase
MLEPTEDYNYTARDGRKQLAQRGIGYMMQYPVFGVGIGNFGRAECSLAPETYDRGPAIRCGAPHNSYVQAGAELGVPGFVLWLAFILGGIVGPMVLRSRMPRHWKDGDAEERYLYRATVFLPVTFASYAVTTFFLTFAWMDITYFLLAYLAGLQAATADKVRQNLIFPPPPEAVGRQVSWRSLRSTEAKSGAAGAVQ